MSRPRHFSPLHRQLPIQTLVPLIVHKAIATLARRHRAGKVHVYGLWVRQANDIPSGSDVMRAIMVLGLRELINMDPRVGAMPEVQAAMACWELTPAEWADLP